MEDSTWTTNLYRNEPPQHRRNKRKSRHRYQPCKRMVSKAIGMTESRGYHERIISYLGLWRYIFMYINIVIPLIYSTTLEIMIILVLDDLGTVGQSCSAHAVWCSSSEHKLWCWTTGCKSWVHHLLGVYG